MKMVSGSRHVLMRETIVSFDQGHFYRFYRFVNYSGSPLMDDCPGVDINRSCDNNPDCNVNNEDLDELTPL